MSFAGRQIHTQILESPLPTVAGTTKFPPGSILPFFHGHGISEGHKTILLSLACKAECDHVTRLWPVSCKQG